MRNVQNVLGISIIKKVEHFNINQSIYTHGNIDCSELRMHECGLLILIIATKIPSGRRCECLGKLL